MKTVCDANKCNGCMACLAVCPRKCITIRDDIYNYNAVIDQTACINCNACERVCPNLSVQQKVKPYKWEQGWSYSDARRNAASGGIASEIIRAFISSGGYVASCLFRNGEFVFDITNDLDTAKCFAGSKYVKSNPEGIYERIKDRLKSHKVLFIGLPCQVAALKNYIKAQDNLYTIDLICHGTPSPRVLSYYLKEHGIANIDITWNVGIPALALAKKINPLFAVFFAIIIFLGIYTTAVPLLWAGIKKLSDITCFASKYKLITVCMGMIGCLTSCFFPYKGLLNFLYGLNGYMGFLLIIFMVVHDVKRLIKMNL